MRLTLTCCVCVAHGTDLPANLSRWAATHQAICRRPIRLKSTKLRQEARMAWTNTKDLELRERAQKVIPGGMYGHQSTVLLPDGYPQFFARAEGTRLWDADGNSYIDYMCAY